MNKQYKVDEEGKKTSFLENYSKETKKKINNIEKTIKGLSNKIHKKNKLNRTLNIALTIIITLLLLVSATINITLFLTTLISIIPISLIVGIIENKILTKDREEIKYYNQRHKEETHILNKIEALIKKKTNTNNINSYNLDSVDYFIEKYQIEKRVREMTKDKPKKLIRKKNTNNLYKI